MAAFVDTAEGIFHFLADRVPSGLPTVPPRPRSANLWHQDGLPIVSKVTANGNVEASVIRCLDLLGGLSRLASAGDTIMVKPNLNSPDPFPGSTDLGFLKTVLSLLLQTRAKVIVGESSGGMWRPTRKTMAKAGLQASLAGMGVGLIAFDDHPRDWVHIDIEGDHLRKVTMPRSAYEATKLIYLPCLKTHNLARFSMSLKLAMGLVHPGERLAMHLSHLEQKVVEINLAWQPDLVIIDGRKVFISGGPDKGEVAEPNVILASGDMVAADVEALKVLLSYKARNKLMPNPWGSPQIVTALRHRLGAGEGEYRLLTA
ncbi:MAG: DUF362 domain-containing protein [Chloroflexi bacterium]|nr:DUF362 domain-containing protein [Chloroflexota bacterium]